MSDTVRQIETPAERDARVLYEEEIVAQAEARLDAGLGIDDDDLEAWLDELEHDPDAPLPSIGTPLSRSR